MLSAADRDYINEIARQSGDLLTMTTYGVQNYKLRFHEGKCTGAYRILKVLSYLLCKLHVLFLMVVQGCNVYSTYVYLTNFIFIHIFFALHTVKLQRWVWRRHC